MRHLPLPYQWGRWGAVTAFACVGLAGTYGLDALVDGMAIRIGAKAAWLLACLAITARLSGMDVATLASTWKNRRAAAGREGSAEVEAGLDGPGPSD